MKELIGQLIGRYHILEQLGQGGMAIVYKAYDTHLDCDVAVKVIRMDNLPRNAEERTIKRFEREAKEVARLNHPNIVRITDYGEFEGIPYLVMPYLHGGTLKQLLGNPVSWQKAVALIEPIARALDYAHKHKMIHRDVKPSNILITDAGDVMLTDFGIVKILDLEDGNTLTGTGVGLGTPEYMAPEQWIGEFSPAVDQYSLGVVLYELITGHKPYSADTPAAVLLKQASEPLPRPIDFVADLPESVEQLLFRALAKKPGDRYQSMEEFSAELKKLESTHAQAKPTPFQEAQIKMETHVESQKKNVKPAPVIQTPVQPYPSVGVRKKGKIRTGGIIAISLAGVGLLTLIIGFENDWFRLKKATIPAEEQIQTEEPTVEDIESAAGTIQISPVDGMPMVYVPAGLFSMGSYNGYDDEQPVNTLYLDGYWIDQTEVTNAMYAQCVAAGDCTVPLEISSYTRDFYYGNSQYDDYPVIYVDWNQAKSYCQWAGRELPTEAQWEKAARGSDRNEYPWGNNRPLISILNCNNNIGDTTVVGNYPEGGSPYGALDMAGNVFEWVADWYNNSYYSQSSAKNPTGPLSGKYRVLRGGSWYYNESYVRSALRYWFNPEHADNNIGFRCALSISVSP